MKKVLSAFVCIFGLTSFAFAEPLKQQAGITCEEKIKGYYILYESPSSHLWNAVPCVPAGGYTWSSTTSSIKVCQTEKFTAPTGFQDVGQFHKDEETRVFVNNSISKISGYNAYLITGYERSETDASKLYPESTKVCIACASGKHWDSDKSKCIKDDPFAGKSCSQFSGEERKQCCNSRWGNSVSRACCISDEADFKAKKNATVYGGICTCKDNTKEWDYTKNQCVAKTTTTSTNTNSNDNTQEIKTIDGINCDATRKNQYILYKNQNEIYELAQCETNGWSNIARRLHDCNDEIAAPSSTEYTDIGVTNAFENAHAFVNKTKTASNDAYLFTANENDFSPAISDACSACAQGYKFDDATVSCIASGTTGANTGTNTTVIPEEPAELKEAKTKLDSFFKYAEASRSGWKTADGKFNSTRLASDITAGVVLGTVGGVVSGVVIKKKQVEKGFEALHCTVGGQTVANWGDEFIIGLQK